MKILFICTHNRCRSILAEAITNQLAGGRIEARSAGSQPAGAVHPLTLKYLSDRGIAVSDLKSQFWDEFETWQPEVVITVCDSAAGEQCPLWFGRALRVHWGLPDPSRVEGTEAEKKLAFEAVISTLERRIQMLLNYPLENLTEQELEKILIAIGEK